jgi:predicted dienelactone hydrolase
MPILSALVAFSLAASATAAAAVALPAPDGAFGVGVVRTEFVDATRRLDPESPDSGPRRLPVVVWYPAERQPGADSAYLGPDVATATLAGIARTFGYTEDDLRPVAAARIAVRVGARPLKRASAFPVVIFSHGLLLFPEQNSVLAARLASHGYIVVSIAHPLDAADQRLEDGRVVAARFDASHDDPRFAGAFDTLVGGSDLVDRREALGTYAAAIGGTRIGRSLVDWRSDTLAVAQAIVGKHEAGALRDALVSADRSRLAFAGMSFGGATSATTCKLVPQCRAAVNLDGQNFDPELFDAPVGRPLLLLLSDWPRYGLLKGQPRDEAFSPNDLAYEPWKSAGSDLDVMRVRLAGSRHMGFTDFVALLEGEKRDARVGEIDGKEALSSVDDLVLAFLDVRLRGADAREVEQALQRHPALQRHVPARMKAWTGG